MEGVAARWGGNLCRAVCKSCGAFYKVALNKGMKLRDFPCPYCGGKGEMFTWRKYGEAFKRHLKSLVGR